MDMYSSFMRKDDVKSKFILKPKNGSRHHTGGNGKSELNSQFRDLKDIVAGQFSTIVEEIRIMHDRLKGLNDRMSKIEFIAGTTVDEVISYYLTIFQNLDNDTDAAKKNLIEDLGRNTAQNLVDQMDKVIQNIACDDLVRERVSRIKEALEED